MEFRAIDGQPPDQRVVKFFAFFGGDADAPRIAVIDLDGREIASTAESMPAESMPVDHPLPVPYLCIVCHGEGPYPRSGGNLLEPTLDDIRNMGAKFREFDLETFTYATALGRTYQALEGGAIRDDAAADAEMNTYKRLNELVRDHSGLPAASPIKQLINGWYRSGSNVPNINFIPDTDLPGAPAGDGRWDMLPDGQPHLYKDVYAGACRGCHIAQDDNIDFSSYEEFRIRRGGPGMGMGPGFGIYGLVCGPNREMPHSRVTYNRFWTSTNPHLPGVLATFSGPGWPAFSPTTEPCPNPAP
jgi:hypothetical protein